MGRGLRALSDSDTNVAEVWNRARRASKRASLPWPRARTPQRAEELRQLNASRRVSEADAQLRKVVLGIPAGDALGVPKRTSTRCQESKLNCPSHQACKELDEVRSLRSVSTALGDATFQKEIELVMSLPKTTSALKASSAQSTLVREGVAPSKRSFLVFVFGILVIVLTALFIGFMCLQLSELQMEIAHLRARLASSEARVVEYETRIRGSPLFRLGEANGRFFKRMGNFSRKILCGQ
ncbi:hypothetical protein AB1Y20_022578 [Prymnesium parvum]|uniref:Cell division protein FtsL n=1 Tax=Prymnesium parvum TaxID=97485 RepID=A0AB34JJ88_PRYPA